jgi:hypothetical protein
LLFYELHDSRLATNKVGAARREYGAAHPKTLEFPNHKLAFIEPEGNEGWERWWYVADRDAQDDYNVEISYPYFGLKEYPRYRRTYVVPRAGYAPLDKGVADPKFPDAKLLFEEVARSQERPIDNLYVIVVRDYDRVPTVTEQELHTETISYPYAGIVACPRYSYRLMIPRQEYDAIPPGTAHPRRTNAKLISEVPAGLGDPRLETLYVGVQRTYDVVPTEVQQEATNARVSFPYWGLSSYPRVTRQYVLPRAGFATKALGTADSIYTSAQLISEETRDFGNPEQDALYQLVIRVFDALPPAAVQSQHNKNTSRPYAGLSAFVRITRDYVFLRTGYTPAVEGSADPTVANAVLLDEQELAFDPEDPRASRYIRVRRVYDDLPSMAVQNAFNREISYPYRGVSAFPRYTRKYVVRRSAYTPLTSGAVDPSDATAVLVTQRADRFDDPSLDSRYLLASHVFDVVPDLSNNAAAALLRGLGFDVTRPYGVASAPRLTWKFPITRSAFTRTPEYSVCPITGYGPALTDPRLVLIDEQMSDDENSPISVIVTRVYELLPGPALESVKVQSTADVPEQFVVSRTETVTRTAENNDATPATVGGDVTAGSGAILRSGVGPTGSSDVVHTKENVRVRVVAASGLTGYELDEDSGQVFPVTQRLVPAGSNSGAGINAAGFYTEVRPFNPHWDILTTRKSTGLTTPRTYTTFVHYAWPAVLLGLDFYAVTKASGGQTYVERYGYNTHIKAAYNGPCLATITEGWTQTPPSSMGNAPTIMIPGDITWNFILSSGQIGPVLHFPLHIYETTGTSDPRYPYQVMQKAFPATNFVNWPPFINASFDVDPWRGGYRYKRVQIQRPST